MSPGEVLASLGRKAEAAYRGVRILLAEDNVINQKVAQGLLHKLGCKADVVVNGAEVVRALELIFTRATQAAINSLRKSGAKQVPFAVVITNVYLEGLGPKEGLSW